MAWNSGNVSWIDWPEPFSYEEGELFFDDWQIGKKLGEGASGSVYSLSREQMGIRQEAAMKVMRVVPDAGTDRMLRSMGQSEQTIANRHRDSLAQVIRELGVMVSLSDHPNVVRCDDFRVYRIMGEDRWDIQIRMEKLTSLEERQAEAAGGFPEAEAIRLGQDICEALVACGEKDLIHRDIKPANLFVDRRGHYKLGDFGTARLDKSGGTMTQRAGTELYMAPEVLRGGHYDKRVDIYSLGLVLYQLMNGNRLPFYPEPEKITQRAMEEAWERRMRGEALPAPEQASPGFARVILKACAYDPGERYATAQEMRSALARAGCADTEEAEETLPPEPEIPAGGQQGIARLLKDAEDGDAAAQEELGRRCDQEDLSAAERQEIAAWLLRVPEEDAAGVMRAMDPRGMRDCGGEGFTWLYHYAAELGSPEACLRLGRCYQKGRGVQENGKAAEYWLGRAGDYPPALCALGLMYERADGIPMDLQKAASLYARAAGKCPGDEGYDASAPWSGEAAYRYGMCLEKGIGVPTDKEAAKKWYEKAALGSEGDAKTLGAAALGGLVKDGWEKVQWYRQAAAGTGEGVYAGMYGLGECSEEGYGVEKDRAKAPEWYQKAAEGTGDGAYKAAMRLGSAYQHGGLGLEKSKDKADEWYRAALRIASTDEQEAQAYLEMASLYSRLNYFLEAWVEPIPPDLSKEEREERLEKDLEVFYLYGNAAEKGSMQAYYLCGLCYYYGVGVPKSKNTAKDWIKDAADNGEKHAKKFLEKHMKLGRLW